MKWILLFALLLTIPMASQALSPPEIIGIIEASPPSVNRFGNDYTCVGDQNSDGFDDLLVSHGYWEGGHGDSVFNNAVELFYGGEEMDDEPDYILSEDGQGPIMFGKYINYLGMLTDSGNPFWAIQTIQEVGWPYDFVLKVRLYEAGEALDDEPEFLFEADSGFGFNLGLGLITSPADFNGDGYDDSLVGMNGDPYYRLMIYHGGEEFDQEPDWIKYLDCNIRGPATNPSTGYDVNGDGYDDILLVSMEHEEVNARQYARWFTLFLGGDPMDTTEIFRFRYDHFEGMEMRSDYRMCQDLNDDGYDDWIIHYREEGRPWNQGYYVFLGGDEPDGEPDMVLPGEDDEWSVHGFLACGDFNGNGIGDIITSSFGALQEDGQLSLYLGSSEFDTIPDLVINIAEEYQYRFGFNSGAEGDYNGDGIADFVIRTASIPYTLGVLGHSEDWVSVSEKPLILTPQTLTVTVSPNPFNSTLNLTFTQPMTGKSTIAIYDLMGRRVAMLHESRLGAGDHRFSWNATDHPAGVYVVKAVSGGLSESRKVVLIR